VQHAIGDHALLADGRTTALVDPGGNVAFLCWPRVDSTPCLFSLLDDQRGGIFKVRPSSPDARVSSRRYHRGTLVLETTWEVASTRVIVEDALAWDDGPRLVRSVRADGDAVDIQVRFAPAFDLGRDSHVWGFDGGTARARGSALALQVFSPGGWSVRDGVACSNFTTSAHSTSVVLQGGDEDALAPGADPLQATLTAWRTMIPHTVVVGASPFARRVLAESTTEDLLLTSAAVLMGLRQRGGGIVAAPTTSLPQWPQSARTWDYRYCWLRDASLAGVALLRLGLVATAAELGEFLGRVIGDAGPQALVRVDGGAAPEERIHDQLSGYRGARPVRTGNAAATQTQLDVAGEVIDFARELEAANSLSAPLAAAASLLAGWLTQHWPEPDHGIWEIRGTPRGYTHSRVMAANGLRWAAALAARGRVRGDVDAWQSAAGAIRHHVLQPDVRALELYDGGGADAALAMVGVTDFLPAADPLVRSTLDLIAERLDRGGLVDRYEGQPDHLPDPCAPFVFPTFLMSMAAAAAGRDATRWFAAACATRGPLGLWGEVAHPDDHTPLGNYPQVQSHAAFVLATTN
jgi:GH15 family glucan-1,4-alpha-glucosidase